jgi:hypothetical protein
VVVSKSLFTLHGIPARAVVDAVEARIVFNAGLHVIGEIHASRTLAHRFVAIHPAVTVVQFAENKQTIYATHYETLEMNSTVNSLHYFHINFLAPRERI